MLRGASLFSERAASAVAVGMTVVAIVAGHQTVATPVAPTSVISLGGGNWPGEAPPSLPADFYSYAGSAIAPVEPAARPLEADPTAAPLFSSDARAQHVAFDAPTTVAYPPLPSSAHPVTRAPAPRQASAPWLAEARRHIGRDGRLVGMSRLWCARFMNFVLRRVGHKGTGSDLAKSFLRLPRVKPQPGAIAVLSRGRRGGHVGIVEKVTSTKVVLVGGNQRGRRVSRSAYPRHRVIAYVMPAAAHARRGG